jgi:septum formation protein
LDCEPAFAFEYFQVVSSSDVKFGELTNDWIDRVISTGEPMDKAGAYAIQEWIGMIAISSIQGDYYNVVGLPVSRIMTELKRLFPG